MIPLRDGVKLATDIYRMEGAASTPVLVARTSYNKDSLANGVDVFDILRAVQAGYTVVTQDVRGRYASEELFNPHSQETTDGLDAFAWTAAEGRTRGMAMAPFPPNHRATSHRTSTSTNRCARCQGNLHANAAECQFLVYLF